MSSRGARAELNRTSGAHDVRLWAARAPSPSEIDSLILVFVVFFCFVLFCSSKKIIILQSFHRLVILILMQFQALSVPLQMGSRPTQFFAMVIMTVLTTQHY